LLLMRHLLRMLLRRRACSLVLLLVLLCLCYQTLMDRNQDRSESEVVLMETRRLISDLEALEEETQVGSSFSSDPYACFLRPGSPLRDAYTTGARPWVKILLLSHLLTPLSCFQMWVEACVSLTHSWQEFARKLSIFQLDGDMNLGVSCFCDRRSPDQARSPALVAMVNVFVLVTSVTPLTSFIHDISVVMTNENVPGQQIEIRTFLLQQLGATTSQQAWVQIQRVVGAVLQAASTYQDQETGGRCLLCFQLLTFTLMFSGSITPVVVQVDTEVTFTALSDTFSRQIIKDLILEDSLLFLLPLPTHLPPETHLSLETLRWQYGGCRGTHSTCLSQDEFLLLLRFHQQLKMPSAFQLVCSPLGSWSFYGP
ncbi:hypothetical protein XENOCAPTIV_014657, partial [Xenoophorus captivus]